MRISDRKVFQNVDDDLYVLADQSTGVEITLNADEVGRLFVGINLAFVNRDPDIDRAVKEALKIAQGRAADEYPYPGSS